MVAGFVGGLSRAMMTRTTLLLGGVVVVAAAVALVALMVVRLSPADDEERTLTLVYWQAPSIPNPYLSGGSKDTDAGAVTLEPLAKYDPDGTLIPALAAEIPTLENGGISSDLTSITWKLREGLKWSDGSGLTAHDVAFTWRYCADEATGCTATSAFSDVTSVDALDDLTVRITFPRGHAVSVYGFRGNGGSGDKPSAVRRLRRSGGRDLRGGEFRSSGGGAVSNCGVRG